MEWYYKDGFYTPEVHTEIPTGAVRISEEYHAELLEKQSLGHTIQPDANGRPIAAPPPAPTLEEAHAVKLAEISAAFELAGATAHVTSSLGFEIDANERANRDTEGLITVLSATEAPGTFFCDYNNAMREVTLEQLKTIRLEIIAHGQALYAKKWLLREAANAAQTVAEIQAVAWEG